MYNLPNYYYLLLFGALLLLLLLPLRTHSPYVPIDPRILAQFPVTPKSVPATFTNAPRSAPIRHVWQPDTRHYQVARVEVDQNNGNNQYQQASQYGQQGRLWPAPNPYLGSYFYEQYVPNDYEFPEYIGKVVK